MPNVFGIASEAAEPERKKRGHYSGFEATVVEKALLLYVSQFADGSGNRISFRRAFSVALAKAADSLVREQRIAEYSLGAIYPQLTESNRETLRSLYPRDTFPPIAVIE